MTNALKRLIQGAGLFVVVAALIIGMISVQALSLYRSYQGTWTLATRTAENAVAVLGAQIERNLSVLDLSLTGLQDAIGMEGLETLPSSVRHTLLFDRAGGVRYLGSLVALDAKGNIRFDSGSDTPRSVNFADREHFRVHVEADHGLYVSAPFRSRLSDQEWTVALTRRISGKDGSFLGVASAALRVAYFQSLLSEVNLGPGSVLRVVNTHGIVIASSDKAGLNSKVGDDIAGTALFHQMEHVPPRPFLLRGSRDGLERYYVTERIGTFPLMVSVGISTVDVMGEWRHQAVVALLVTLADCALLVLMFVVLRAALARSQQMEARMKELASTDSLTGMSNRRALNLVLPRALGDAARFGQPLAVLMVDIDHFKSVNDTHGHSVGDEVLRRVGEVIDQTCRRRGDIAVRYGGEEFVALLSGTGPQDALGMAEKLRRAVMEMTPSLTTPALKQVTVSVGFVAGPVTQEMSPDDLLKAADQALYAAKAAGRNCVVQGTLAAPGATG